MGFSLLDCIGKMYSNRVHPKQSYEYTIIGNWNGGGMCPWQMYLPIWYNDKRYTIYLRERHDITSCKIFDGKVSIYHREKGVKIITGDLFEGVDINKIPFGIDEMKLAEYAVDDYFIKNWEDFIK